MELTPSFTSFEQGFSAGQNQLVYTRLAADLDTPVSLMLKLTGAAKNAFMLESVTGGEVRGRYSIIGMKPDLVWQCHGTKSRLNRQARFDESAFEEQPGDPLANLRALLAESRIEMPEDLPAASAGLFGYLGYDMIRLVEHLPNVPEDTLGLPDAVLLRPTVTAVLDGVKGEVIDVSPTWTSDGLSARAAYAQAAERVMDAVRDLERALPNKRVILVTLRKMLNQKAISPTRATKPPSRRPKTTFEQAIYSKWCLRSAGHSPSVSPPSRSTVRCAAPTPHPSCSISTSVGFRSSVLRPKFLCVCLATR